MLMFRNNTHTHTKPHTHRTIINFSSGRLRTQNTVKNKLKKPKVPVKEASQDYDTYICTQATQVRRSRSSTGGTLHVDLPPPAGSFEWQAMFSHYNRACFFFKQIKSKDKLLIDLVIAYMQLGMRKTSKIYLFPDATQLDLDLPYRSVMKEMQHHLSRSTCSNQTTLGLLRKAYPAATPPSSV